MKVVIACDHRGFDAKRRLLPSLKKLGHEVVDLGCDSTASCDYPDYAAPAARGVAKAEFDTGILLDGSGIGMAIVANKVHGVRAAIAHDELTARQSREKNHCNMLCIGTDLLGEDQIRKIVEIFLSCSFQGGRHVERIAKIKEIEEQG